jgi:Flp pilus assembly pilin Flp
MNVLREVLADETGAALAEYAMLLALMGLTVIAAIKLLRTQIVGVFQRTASNLGAAK